MGQVVSYLTFIGAKAHWERLSRNLNPEVPLVVMSGSLVQDCDEKAWRSGVRPGDTLRQAKIAAPGCQVIKSAGDDIGHLKGILDALSTASPLLEPSEDGSGVFIDLPQETPVVSYFPSLSGMFAKAFVGSSRSKMLAKSAAIWISEQYASNQKLFPGKVGWGSLKQAEDYLWADIEAGKEKVFLANAPIKLLWQVPAEVIFTLTSLGLKRIKDLQKISAYDLSRQIGDWAYPIKEWANGEDRSRVKPLYPPMSITREADFQEPVVPCIEMLEPKLGEIARELSEKGLGCRTIRLSLNGDFPVLSRQKKLARTACSLPSIRLAVKSLLEEMILEAGTQVPQNPSVTGFCLTLSDLSPVFSKPISLFGPLDRETETRAIPVSLGLALDGLESKFGHNAVTWGKKDKEDRRFKPEVLRREQMLSIWDPMRIAPEQAVGS
ncbi:MAG TPA: hypothetical protein GXX23_00620 [Firmicutes bacterium]|nr:hypothetical protein [Candidatus Fermentithermobacillaceae bacterium]